VSKTLTLLAVVASVALAGCASAPPPTAAPAPVQPQPAVSAPLPDEQAYLAALGPGTTPADLVSIHSGLRDATLEAGYGACSIIDMASTPELGMLQVLDFAEQHLSGDPFTADMPALFTAAAAVHLCGVDL